jgi:hypothetical protein
MYVCCLSRALIASQPHAGPPASERQAIPRWEGLLVGMYVCLSRALIASQPYAGPPASERLAFPAMGGLVGRYVCVLSVSGSHRLSTICGAYLRLSAWLFPLWEGLFEGMYGQAAFPSPVVHSVAPTIIAPSRAVCVDVVMPGPQGPHTAQRRASGAGAAPASAYPDDLHENGPTALPNCQLQFRMVLSVCVCMY